MELYTTDPYRALGLTIRSARVLSVGSNLIGVLIIVFLGLLNKYALYRWHFVAIGIGIFLAPGIAYGVAVARLRRHDMWGLIAAICGALVQIGGAIVMIIGIVIVGPVSPIPIALIAMWLLAVGQFLLHLLYARSAIRLENLTRQRGFAINTPNPESNTSARSPE